jgi:hypothetical protein
VTACTSGRLWATSARALDTRTDGEGTGSASAAVAEDAVSALWASAWKQLRAAYPDVEAKLAELLKKLLVWEVAVLAELDSRRSQTTISAPGRPTANSSPAAPGGTRLMSSAFGPPGAEIFLRKDL